MTNKILTNEVGGLALLGEVASGGWSGGIGAEDGANAGFVAGTSLLFVVREFV